MSDLSDITPDPIISEDVDAEEFGLLAASEPETVEVYKDYTAAAEGACAWANKGIVKIDPSKLVLYPRCVYIRIHLCAV